MWRRYGKASPKELSTPVVGVRSGSGHGLLCWVGRAGETADSHEGGCRKIHEETSTAALVTMATPLPWQLMFEW